MLAMANGDDMVHSSNVHSCRVDCVQLAEESAHQFGSVIVSDILQQVAMHGASRDPVCRRRPSNQQDVACSKRSVLFS